MRSLNIIISRTWLQTGVSSGLNTQKAMYHQVIVLLSSISLVRCSMAPTRLLMTRAGPCTGVGNTPISVSELSLSTHTYYDSLLSGEFNVSKDIENGWKIKGTVQKCVDIRNMESCDFFRSFYIVKNGCGDDNDDETEQDTYNMMFHYTEPKLQCPIKAGNYKLIDYPFFTEDNYLVVLESKISTSVFGYTFRLDAITESRQKIFCIEAVLQLLYTRKHNWANKINVQETTLSPVATTIEEEEE